MTPPDSVMRRAACLAASSFLLATLAHAAPPLPVRNLVVEMRIVEDSAETRHDARAANTATLGNTGRSDPGAGASVRSNTLRQGIDAVQGVLVLNGGRAGLRLSQGMPVDDIEIIWTPWGPGAALRSQWVEVVNGMEVAPRWPGGQAPVTVDISAQRGTGLPQGNTPGMAAQLSLFTTVQAPLGEWIEVAQLQRRQAAVSGSGFSAATSSRQRSLQLRVSLP